jgi:hypothetical protein
VCKSLTRRFRTRSTTFSTFSTFFFISSTLTRAFPTTIIIVLVVVSTPSIRNSLVRLFVVITTIIPLAHDTAAFRENNIIKACTIISVTRYNYYINSFILNKKIIDIKLAANNNLAYSNTIWVNNNIITRQGEYLLLEVIIILRSRQFSFSYKRNYILIPQAIS